jgi:uncharacterized lipoprotein YddW (UPF0748 family)
LDDFHSSGLERDARHFGHMPYRCRWMLARSILTLTLAALCGCTTAPPVTSSGASAGYGSAKVSAPRVQQEFRAMWIATVYNIDWPSKAGLSASRQKAELITILNKAKSLNMNAVVLQVRPGCDALYQSSIEPASPWLSGTMGKSSGYDALAFAVGECHARGIELHAWVNPFRAKTSDKQSVSSSHVSRRNPSWIRKYDGKVWLDPGLPEVRNYSLRVINDIVARYDVDGIHIDDYFYPYPKNPKARPIPEFPDATAYRKYGQGKSRGDWRRDNINKFVASMYSSVKAKKPWVKVGISPFGVWQSGVPRGVKADLDPMNMLYADSRLWLRNGWLDYISPQLYWPIKGDQSYSKLIAWWDSQNVKRRHIWPGIASERIGVKRSAREIGDQIGLARSPRRRSTPGHIHWSASALMDNKRGVSDMLAKSFYQSAATVPAMPWMSASAPGQPTLSARAEGGSLFVDWKKGTGNSPSGYVVQNKVGGAWKPAVLVSAVRKGMKFDIGREGAPAEISITPVDRYGNLGPAAGLVRR